METVRPITLYVPKRFPVRGPLFWPAAYIVNRIWRGEAGWKHDNGGLPGIAVNATVCKQVLGRRSNAAMDAAIDSGVIQCVKGYSAGLHSRLFRLTPEYAECYPFECEDEKINAAVASNGYRQAAPVRLLQDRARTIRICADEANAVARSFVDDHGSLLISATEAARRSIQIIEDRNCTIGMDQSHGRVFAPWCWMDKRLRKFLRTSGGEELVEVDIANCQPTLLPLAAAQFFSSDRHVKSRMLGHQMESSGNPYLWPTLRTISAPLAGLCTKMGETGKPLLDNDLGAVEGASVQHIGIYTKNSPPPPLVSSDASAVSVRLPDDVLAWKELAESGRLYEHFGGVGSLRDEVKQQFLVVMFDKRPLTVFPVGRQLVDEFPSIARVVTSLKWENCFAKQREPRPYRYLSCLLQLYESTLMIYRVCGELLTKHPEVPVFPIHDCILTTPTCRPLVERVIKDVWGSVNLFPSIKGE